jgi:crossover junction endonuclease MUS81
VLDVILERKTVNDLAASIIDGRYNEQKVRLKQAAIPTSAYIIEGNLSAQDRMDPGSLRTAMTTTEVIHGLRVIPTRNIDHSLRVIQSLFEQQVRAWPQTFEAFTSGRRAPVLFADFQKKFVKRSAQTVGDVFRAQLRQIPNCSATRASVLNRQFETMRQMLQHFDRLPNRKAVEQSLTALQSEQRTRPIGPALAKFITRLYLDEF